MTIKNLVHSPLKNKSMLWPPTQTSKFHENQLCVSCFIVGSLSCESTTLRRILEPLPPIEVNDEHEYKVNKILDSQISNY